MVWYVVFWIDEFSIPTYNTEYSVSIKIISEIVIKFTTGSYSTLRVRGYTHDTGEVDPEFSSEFVLKFQGANKAVVKFGIELV